MTPRREQLTSKMANAVATKIASLTDRDFFSLLQNGGELIVASGTSPNGQSCELVAIWQVNSDNLDFAGDCSYVVRGPAGEQKIAASQVDKVLGMLS